MTAKLFCLPPLVNCKFEPSNVSIIGPQGSVTLKLNIPFVQRSRFICFSRPLRWSEKALFLKAIWGVSLSYDVTLTLRGIGYRSDLIDQRLCLKLGYSHEIYMHIPDTISLMCLKNQILLRSCQFEDLYAFATKVRKLRSPNVYKGNGVLYKGESFVLKEGKKA